MPQPELTIKIGANSSLFRKDLDKVEQDVIKRMKFLDSLDREQKAVFLAREAALNQKKEALAKAHQEFEKKQNAEALAREARLQKKRQALVRNTSLVFAASVAGGAAAVKSFATFESQLVATVRTTGLAGKELDTFKGKMREVSEEMGVSQVKLLEIAEAAGTLGIQGADDLAKFTETMAKFDVASATLRGGEAATAIARIINLTGGGIQNVDRFASEIAYLADNFSSTEAEIVANAEELSKLNGVLDLSTQDVLGLSSAFAEFGFSPEIGRTSLLLFSNQLDEALRKSGDDMRLFMRVTGMTEEQLRKAFGEDPRKLLVSFFEGMSKAGADSTKILADLGLSSRQSTPLFLAAAGSVDRIKKALKEGNEEYVRNTKLNNELALSLDTTEGRWNRSKEAIRNMGIELGSTLAPAVLFFAEETTKHLKNLREGLEAVGVISSGVAEILKQSFNIIIGDFELLVSKLFRKIAEAQLALSKIAITDAQKERLLGGVDFFGGKSIELEAEGKAKLIGGAEFFDGEAFQAAIKGRLGALNDARALEREIEEDHLAALAEIRNKAKETAKETGTLDPLDMTDEEFDESMAKLEERLSKSNETKSIFAGQNEIKELQLLKKSAKNAKEREKIDKALYAAQEKYSTQAMITQVTNLDQVFGQETAIGKAIFLFNKAQAIANTITSTQKAMALARATIPPPGGDAVAAKYAIAGAINVGIIGATAIQGFEIGSMSVPSDMLANIHKGEMIIPKPFADSLRDTLNGNQSQEAIPSRIEIDLTDRASEFITVNQREDFKLGIQR